MSATNEALVRRFLEEFCNQRCGKIAEEWTVWDALGLLQQVGAVPLAA